MKNISIRITVLLLLILTLFEFSCKSTENDKDEEFTEILEIPENGSKLIMDDQHTYEAVYSYQGLVLQVNLLDGVGRIRMTPSLGSMKETLSFLRIVALAHPIFREAVTYQVSEDKINLFYPKGISREEKKNLAESFFKDVEIYLFLRNHPDSEIGILLRDEPVHLSIYEEHASLEYPVTLFTEDDVLALLESLPKNPAFDAVSFSVLPGSTTITYNGGLDKELLDAILMALFENLI